MTTFIYPFPPTGAQYPPCPTGTECSSYTGCFICGYDPTGCGPSGCKDYFFSQHVNYTFLNGFIQGFSGKLGIGGSESYVNVDLVFEDNRCYPSGGPTGCFPCPSGSGYDGRLGYLYTFSMGTFCFRGILTNHTYSEDTGGYKYRLTLNDGRNLLSKITIILNNIYDRPPSGLQHQILSSLYFLEPSIDDCDGWDKCNDFMRSGANTKGIFLKKALEQLNNKQIQIPISKACLRLKLDRLISIMPSTYRTNQTESSLLELIELCCEETGHDFFVQITRDNELEILPVNYTIPVSGTPLLNLITKFSSNDLNTATEYGEEMTFEKNKRLIFGDNFHYLTIIESSGINPTGSCPPSDTKIFTVNPTGIIIDGNPFYKLVTRNIDEPIPSTGLPASGC